VLVISSAITVDINYVVERTSQPFGMEIWGIGK
jgi:hypothetical protein